MSLHQLNSIHKSAIRCLSSFVYQYDRMAQIQKEKEVLSGTGRRSISPVMAPVPNQLVYNQISSLLEKLEKCYHAYSKQMAYK